MAAAAFPSDAVKTPFLFHSRASERPSEAALSLKEPAGLHPSILHQTFRKPTLLAKVGASTYGVHPSPSETMLFSRIGGRKSAKSHMLHPLTSVGNPPSSLYCASKIPLHFVQRVWVSVGNLLLQFAQARDSNRFVNAFLTRPSA